MSRPRTVAVARRFVVLVVGLMGLGCGGQVGKVAPASGGSPSSSEPADGGESSAAGSTGGAAGSRSGPESAGTGGAASTAPQFDPAELAACRGVATIRRQFREELNEIESRPPPPEPPAMAPEYPPTPCFSCPHECQAPVAETEGDCGPIHSCVERHCLCEDCVEVDDTGQAMCACVESCMPAGATTCRDVWRGAVACEVAACLQSCQ